MSVPEQYVDDLYRSLRSRDVRIVWSELRDALEEVSSASEADHPCGDWPAPCNCDDPITHDRSLG